MRRLVIAAIFAVMLRGAEPAAPSQLYIVSQFFSDNGPAFYYRLIELSQEGEVVNASAISGHPLLAPTALDAAKQWRFNPELTQSETLRVTLDYAFRCP